MYAWAALWLYASQSRADRCGVALPERQAGHPPGYQLWVGYGPPLPRISFSPVHAFLALQVHGAINLFTCSRGCGQSAATQVPTR